MKAATWKTRLLYWFTYAIVYRVSASWGWKLEQRAMYRHLRDHFPGKKPS